jgi:hypothetical protein
MLGATAAGILSVGMAAALFFRRPEPATLRSTFIVQALGVIGLGTGWLAAVAF